MTSLKDVVQTNSGVWNEVTNKLDSSSFSDVSGTFYTNDNPSGFITGVDLSNYYTKTEIDTTVTTINSSIAGVATRVTSLETTVTSLSSRVTTLETSKQDKLSTTQISAINTVVDLNLHSRTFTNWESES